MKTKGKLFFDFTVPAGEWQEAQLQTMRLAAEKKINGIDPWNEGYCERNKWLNLWDVPTVHAEMRGYLNSTTTLGPLPVQADDPGTTPIAYCYNGESRICYHPHPLLENDGKTPWMAEPSNLPKFQMLIVVTYETKCFGIS